MQVDCFKNYNSDGADENDELELAAIGSLDAIATLMEGLSEQPDLFPPMKEAVMPVCHHCVRVKANGTYNASGAAGASKDSGSDRRHARVL